jgi:hypothetical protein
MTQYFNLITRVDRELGRISCLGAVRNVVNASTLFRLVPVVIHFAQRVAPRLTANCGRGRSWLMWLLFRFSISRV